jgi:hypothetical protein
VQSGLGVPVANFQRKFPSARFNAINLNEARGIDRGTNTCDIGRDPGRAVFPTDRARRAVECIHVTDAIGSATLVRANED